MTYGKALQKILDFKLTGVTFHWLGKSGDGFLSDNNWEELPPDKMGFEANLLSFKIEYDFEILGKTSRLPRKKKKKLAMHFNKKYNKLKRLVDAMED